MHSVNKTEFKSVNDYDNNNSSGDKIANVNFFYDDIAHVLQNTKKRELTSFNKLDISYASTAHYVLNLRICYRISTLQL